MKKTIIGIASTAVLAVGGFFGVRALTSTPPATSASTWAIYARNSDSTLAQVGRQTYANNTAKGQVQAVIRSNRASDSLLINQINYNGSAPVTPTNPGGTPTTNLNKSNETGKKYSQLTFNSGNNQTVQLLFTNCTNDTIEWCTFANTTAISARFVNCKNIVFRNNFMTMTNFGVRFENCVGVICNANQGLNLNGANPVYNKNFAHWIQSVNCTGHQEYNDNRLQSIINVALRPHDAISIDNCSGVKGDSIQIKRNWIDGGQQVPFPTSNDTGGGIMGPDEAGNYYSITDNIIRNTGVAGWQAVGTGSSVRFANNIIYNNIVNQVAADGIVILSAKTAFVIQNNRVWWKNKHGNAVQNSQGETSYWLGGSPTMPGVTFIGNKWLDTTIDANTMFSGPIITYHL